MNQRVELTAENRRLLEAATARIIPSSDGPGAAEANVIGFVEWLTEQDFFESIYLRLRDGLGLLQASAVQHHGKGFAECTAAEQDAVLERIQSIPLPPVRRFFKTLVDMTIAGFLCDPGYGGNRDLIGWRYLGFERRGPSIAGREGRCS